MDIGVTAERSASPATVSEYFKWVRPENRIKRNHGFVIGMTLAFKELPWSGMATFGGSGG